jgi:hypothetical protein
MSIYGACYKRAWEQGRGQIFILSYLQGRWAMSIFFYVPWTCLNLQRQLCCRLRLKYMQILRAHARRLLILYTECPFNLCYPPSLVVNESRTNGREHMISFGGTRSIASAICAHVVTGRFTVGRKIMPGHNFCYCGL